MTDLSPEQIKKYFPNVSQGTLEANCFISPLKPKKKVTETPVESKEHGSYFFIIEGQIRGGKNNMIVTRSGLHFPKKEWAKWRDEKVSTLKSQLPLNWSPISIPCDMHLSYLAGDKRRRDNPAIVDAIFHVLEKAGVVTDDTLVWPVASSRGYDKEISLSL